ncbi:MAG TPA: Fic family protein [Gammaproteobacteria bacterium]|nr:Fic family protein [Gammaproteobacteria bacterium]
MKYQPPFTLTDEIIDLIAQIAHALGKLDHIQYNPQALQLRKISQIKTITGTLQIEGNTLTEQQITAVLEGKTVLAPMREISEAQGAILLYQQADQFNYQNPQHLLQAHQLLMGDLLNRAGQYRNKGVGIYGADGVSHVAPPANRVPGLMSELFAWLQETTIHPLIRSSVFHYEFEFIHPFEDGNGRMGRFWQYLMLNHWNPVFSLIPVENMIKSKQQGYYEALQQSGASGESTLFIRYMCETILEAINTLETQSDQASDQASDQVKKLLSVLTDNWLSTNEIMQLLGLSHKPTFRKNYLEPALKQQYIEMQYPDSPRSPKQKYRKHTA